MNPVDRQELKTLTKRFIEQYYPPIKQQSDQVDQIFWQTWLVARAKLNANDVAQLVYDAAARVLDGKSTIQMEVEMLDKRYPGTAQAWEQLIKIGVRVGWIQKIKQLYREFLNRNDLTPSDAIKLYPKLEIE